MSGVFSKHLGNCGWRKDFGDMRKWLAVAGWMCVGLGCGAPSEDVETVSSDPTLGSLEEAINGGTAVASNVAPFSSVVRLGNNCSAVKIKQTDTTSTFLSAAHCASPNPGGPTTVNISNALDATAGGQLFNVPTNGIVRHPSDLLVNGTNANEYDIESITVSNTTSGIPKATLGGALPTADNTSLVGVGYGQPLLGTKQQGGFTAGAEGASGLDHVHNIVDLSAPSLGTGDSGGGVFAGNNLVGINSRGSASSSAFARVGNVLDWINTPLAGNAAALRVDQSTVFLYNTKNKIAGLCLASAVGTPSPPTAPINAILHQCDGPNGLQTHSPPGFRLLTSPVPPGGGPVLFQILNRFNGRCLTVDQANPTGDVSVLLLTCDTSATSTLSKSQAWSFGNQGSEINITNKLSGKCLGTVSGATSINSQLGQKACQANPSGTDQGWQLVR